MDIIPDEECSRCIEVNEDYKNTCTNGKLGGLDENIIKNLSPYNALVMIGLIDFKKALWSDNVIFSESSIEFPTFNRKGKMTLKLSPHRTGTQSHTTEISIIYTIMLVSRYCDIVQPIAQGKISNLFNDLMAEIINLDYSVHLEFHDCYVALCARALNITKASFLAMYDQWDCILIR